MTAPLSRSYCYLYDRDRRLAEERDGEGVHLGWSGSLLVSDTRTGLVEGGIAYGHDDDFRVAWVSYAGEADGICKDDGNIRLRDGSRPRPRPHCFACKEAPDEYNLSDAQGM